MATIYAQSPHSELFFKFGDKAGEANFIFWHQMRHRTYDLIASKNGNSFPALDLTGPVNDDWFYRHAVRHASHRRLLGATKGFNTYGLPRVNWKSSNRQADWLRLHALDHADLDAFYGLT